jgi:hypothetical protein
MHLDYLVIAGYLILAHKQPVNKSYQRSCANRTSCMAVGMPFDSARDLARMHEEEYGFFVGDVRYNVHT